MTESHMTERNEQEEKLRLKFIQFVKETTKDHFASQNLKNDSIELDEFCVVTTLGSLPLHEFAMSGVAKDIKNYLNKHKKDVDCKDPDSGATPLMTACGHGHVNAVRLLLSHGADVNYKCSGLSGYGLKYSNVTPAYIAAEEGYDEVLELLVEKGADINQKCLPLGYTPLHRAICRGHKDLVYKMVHNMKAIVNVPNSEGDDPVLTAVKKKKYDILHTLLTEPNVDCANPSSHDRVTPLHHAAYVGDFKAVEILLTHGKPNVNAELVGGFTPLDLAIQQSHKKIVDLLRKHKAQRNIKNINWEPFPKSVAGGLTPLKEAVSRGAKVDTPLRDGCTALHYNVTKLNWECCKFLLKNGADVNCRNHLGNTPLHLAAKIGKIDYVKLLLEHGADVTAVNSADSTPLHAAAKGGDRSVVELLVSHGADLNAVEYQGGTPMFSAASSGHTEVVEYFLSCGVDPNCKAHIDGIDNVSILVISCMHAGNKPDMIRSLVNAGADVNYSCVSKQRELTPLTVLPLKRHRLEESLKVLIEAGAFIDAPISGPNKAKLPINAVMALVDYTENQIAKNIMKNTLELFKAVRRDNMKLAKESVAEGGLVNCCSVKFETPLIYASWKGFTQMVKFLLKQGASLKMQSVTKSSPLHYAVKFNHKPIVIELLRAGAQPDEVCCGKTPLQLAESGKFYEIAALLKFVADWPVNPNDINPLDDPNFRKRFEQTNDKVLEKDLCALFGGISIA